jgi:murein DD-endopeptidase MepM/ murein hydrolase activator NlpD
MRNRADAFPGGQTAVQWNIFAGTASGGLASAPSGSARTLVVSLVAGSAILAITAAAALPSRSQRAQAKPAAAPVAAPVNRASARTESPPEAGDVAARRYTGRVGSNLSDSLAAAGVPKLQGREYVAILGRAIQLASGLSVDDKFDLVLERGPDGKLGQLLYVGLDRVARADVELLKWTDGKSVIWVNADGVGGQDSARMGLPVHGRLTSGFGERFHPILGYRRFHAGLDLAATAGTPIVAAADGRVIGAGWRGGYGQQVQIAHAGGIDTLYGHMSRIAAHAGELVRKGQVIGYVGSTGLSTGPHLHFEVTKNGRPVNPASVKLSGGPGHLEGAKLQAFHDELRGLLLAGRAS